MSVMDNCHQSVTYVKYNVEKHLSDMEIVGTLRAMKNVCITDLKSDAL